MQLIWIKKKCVQERERPGAMTFFIFSEEFLSIALILWNSFKFYNQKKVIFLFFVEEMERRVI